MATSNLIVLELRRLILRPRFLLVLALMLGLSVYSIYNELSYTVGGAHVQGALSLTANDWLPLTLPLVVGVVAAGSLAEDRRRGYVPLVLARGVSRRQYLLAKGTAMSLSSALAIGIGCLVFLAIAALTLPAGRTPFSDGSGIDAAGNEVIIPAAQFYPGPLPNLFAYSPFLNDLLSISMLMFAAGALALTGLIVGTIVPNEYVATATPFLLVVMALFVFTNGMDFIGLYTYIDIWIQYKSTLPAQVLGYAAFVYWLVFGLAMFATACWFFVRREID